MFKLLNIPELSIILNITSNSNDIYIELTIVPNIYSNLVKSLNFSVTLIYKWFHYVSYFIFIFVS